MRIILALTILFLTSHAFADEILCYNNGRVVYKKQGENFTYVDGMFVFKELNSDNVIFAGLDCLVKINT